MIRSLLLGDGPVDIEIVYIVGITFAPSIVSLLLALFALWLPDDGYVSRQQFDERQSEHHRTNDGQRDWRRAA